MQRIFAQVIVLSLVGWLIFGIAFVEAIPTVTLSGVSLPAIAEPSTNYPADDKDGEPPGTIVGNADPSKFVIEVNCTIDSAITGVTLTLLNTNHNPLGTEGPPPPTNPVVTDYLIDNDNPRIFSILAAGKHYFYWSMNKNQTASQQGNAEQYQVQLSWTGPVAGSVTSAPFNIVGEGSASIKQNDLAEKQTYPTSQSAVQGEIFRVLIKWEQKSSSLSDLAAEIYYQGAVLRLINFSIYFYDTGGTPNPDPGDITTGIIPAGWHTVFHSDTYLNSTQLSALPISTQDYWIGEYTFEVISGSVAADSVIPYSQTKLASTANWKMGPGKVVPVLLNFGKITVTKDAVPDDPKDFTFKCNSSLIGTFILDDDGDPTYPSKQTFSVPKGTYNISEIVPSGWSLTGINIQEKSPTNSSYNLNTNSTRIKIDPGEWVNVTFTDKKWGNLTIIKDAVPNDPKDFTFNSNSTRIGTFTLDDDSDPTLPDRRTFGVPPGTYNISEIVPSGWSLTGINIQEKSPTNSSYNLNTNSSKIKVDPGEWANVTFTDTKEGRINIVKDAVPDNPQSFPFKSNNTGAIPDFSLVDNGGVNNRTFHVAPGTYNVSEIVPPGWSLTGIGITEDKTSNSLYNVNTNSTKLVVEPGEFVEVTFTDKKDGKITVIKDAVPDDPQSFSFNGNGTIGAFSLVDNGGSNSQTFSVKPGTYNVSEIVPPGWSLTGINIQEKSPTNSSYNLNTNSTRLKVDPGEWVNVTFLDARSDVLITKQLTSSDPTLVGSNVVFQIVVTNNGGTTLTGVNVTDKFDTAYLDFVSSTPTQTSLDEAAGKISWNNTEVYAPGGTFDPTETITITVTFKATAVTPDPTKAQNCANVTAKFETSIAGDGPSCDDVEINQPDIEIKKILTSDDPTTVGSTVTFQIEVTNTGSTTLTDVDVTDTFETSYLDFVSASISPTNVDEGAGTITWNNIEGNAPGGTFDPTETITITVTFTATAATPDEDRAGNCASVTANDQTVSDGPACDDVEINEERDLGDAPDPTYPTLLGSNGARHVIGTIWMGNTVDAETDGQPSTSANGDDLNPGGGPDDEDGVIFLGAGSPGGPYLMPYIVGQNGAVQIKVSGDVSDQNPAYLHGWIDWNQDGDWNDAGENIFSGTTITAPGDYTINFAVPADAKPGKTYARFRIDDQNLNSPTGEAANGEVEDYLVDPAVREPPGEIERRPVAGYVMPTNKLAILSPYLALAGLVGILSSIIVFRRRRKN